MDTDLLPYQSRWINDSSRLKIAEKARQIGWTWATALGLVARASLKQCGSDAWIGSRDELQARLFIEDCKGFARILNIAAQDLGEIAVSRRGHTAFVLQFANGRRAHSLSSNPDAHAGKRGHRILDEFALHPDPRRLYAVAYPGITWGGSLEIISTHLAFESRSVRIPEDPIIRADLRAIKKETTPAGNIRFTADRGKNGHADRFCALALAIHAASQPPAAGPILVFTEGRIAQARAQRRERCMEG